MHPLLDLWIRLSTRVQQIEFDLQRKFVQGGGDVIDGVDIWARRGAANEVHTERGCQYATTGNTNSAYSPSHLALDHICSIGDICFVFNVLGSKGPAAVCRGTWAAVTNCCLMRPGQVGPSAHHIHSIYITFRVCPVAASTGRHGQHQILVHLHSLVENSGVDTLGAHLDTEVWWSLPGVEFQPTLGETASSSHICQNGRSCWTTTTTRAPTRTACYICRVPVPDRVYQKFGTQWWLHKGGLDVIWKVTEQLKGNFQLRYSISQ